MDDANSPDLDKKLIGKVTSDFIKVSENLKEASYQIKKRGFSEFPVFVLTENVIELGNTLFTKSDFETVYEYKASFLEEFVERELIGIESKELFKENYKDPEEFCCLFVIDNNFAGFIYIPYPVD
jgi:hypothetical protein